MSLAYGGIGFPGTPTAGALYPSSSLAVAEAKYRAALKAKVGYAERSLASAYGQAFKQVERELAANLLRVQSEMAKGHYSPAWGMQQERYASLLNQYRAAISTFSTTALSQAHHSQQEGIQSAMAHTPTQVRDYGPKTAPTGVTLADYGPETWGRINNQAFARAMGYLAQNDAPLRQLFDKMGVDTVHAVQKEWAKGFGLGYNPNKIARNIKNATANIALGRAKTIARTEFHRAYRETKRQQYMESDVIKGWVWKANLDSETCGLCVAMGGSLHPADDVMDSHPNCRCTMVPLTKTWDELGFPGVANDVPQAYSVPNGPAWLGQQSEAQVLRTLGKARGQDFINKGGMNSPAMARILTRSYVRQTSSPTWGPMKQLAPFKGPGKMAAGVAPPPAPPAPPKPPPAPPKPPAVPKPPAAPKPAPKAVPLAPVAKAVSAVQHGLNNMFGPAVKAVKSAQTKLGNDWLKGKTGSASAAKEDIAKTLSRLAETEMNTILRDWDGNWDALKNGYGFNPATGQATGGMIPTSGQYYNSRYSLPKQWSFMTPAERDAVLASAEGALLREDFVARFIQTWAATSADAHPLSLLVQYRAGEVFQMQHSVQHLASRTQWAEAKNAPKSLQNLTDEMLKAMYRNTQAELAAAGITTIRLARGIRWTSEADRPAFVNENGGMYRGEVRAGEVEQQPLSSWSASTATANSFGHGGYVMTAQFPASWIIGSARTGFGCLHEGEFVVAGGRPFQTTVKKIGW